MNSSSLIQVDELARLLAAGPTAARPVVLDVRYRMGGSTGFQDFDAGHVPGASNVGMDAELATIRPDGAGGRHPMPTAETLSAALRSAGVTMSRPVVAYDDKASLPASRVWWTLRHLGFAQVRVLDGGFAAWTAAGQPTESGPGATGAGDFTPSLPGRGRLLDATHATAYALGHLLLDARSASASGERTRPSTRSPVTSPEPSAPRPWTTWTGTRISCGPRTWHAAFMSLAWRTGRSSARTAAQAFRPPTWRWP